MRPGCFGPMAAGAHFVQEFPPDCVPLCGGVATVELAHYVAARALSALA